MDWKWGMKRTRSQGDLPDLWLTQEWGRGTVAEIGKKRGKEAVKVLSWKYLHGDASVLDEEFQGLLCLFLLLCLLYQVSSSLVTVCPTSSGDSKTGLPSCAFSTLGAAQLALRKPSSEPRCQPGVNSLPGHRGQGMNETA